MAVLYNANEILKRTGQSGAGTKVINGGALPTEAQTAVINGARPAQTNEIAKPITQTAATGPNIINGGAVPTALKTAVINGQRPAQTNEIAKALPATEQQSTGPKIINGGSVADYQRQTFIPAENIASFISQYQQNAPAQSGYTPSDAVLAAQAYLQQQIAGKPGAYSSKYGAQLDSLLNEMMNRPAFTYDARNDPIYNIYKDMYIQNGRRAMQDTMGNAAALTGGYGSSYAQSAGQQMYNQYMENLNSVVPQLQQQAYQRYSDEGDRMAQNFQMMNQLENQNYTQYRDSVGDWQLERQLAQQAALQAEQMDRQQYQYDTTFRENQRQFNSNDAYRQAQLAEQIRQANLDEAYRRMSFDESVRQYNQNFAENVRQADLDEAYRQAQAAEAIRQWNANFNENVRQADLDEAYRQQQAAEAVRQYNQNFAENVRQADLDEAYRQQQFAENVRQADLDEAYRQQTFNENVRQADLDEAYRQAQLAESIRQWNATFGEDTRQYDENLAEKIREFDLAHGLDQANFDLTVRKYEDALAQQGSGGSSGGNTQGNTKKDETPAATQNTETAKQIQDVVQQFIKYVPSEEKYNARKNKNGTYDDYIASTVTSFLRDGRLTNNEALAVLDYYIGRK